MWFIDWGHSLRWMNHISWGCLKRILFNIIQGGMKLWPLVLLMCTSLDSWISFDSSFFITSVDICCRLNWISLFHLILICILLHLCLFITMNTRQHREMKNQTLCETIWPKTHRTITHASKDTFPLYKVQLQDSLVYIKCFVTFEQVMLRRMVYLAIKELANIAEDVIIVTSRSCNVLTL